MVNLILDILNLKINKTFRCVYPAGTCSGEKLPVKIYILVSGSWAGLRIGEKKGEGGDHEYITEL